ncbi:ribosomal maturation YjgA family protein [Bradyrhizobium sp. USDA 4353]
MALVTALVVIALGLGLRFYGLGVGLPAFIVKYGGSILWAMMVYMLLVALLPLRSWRQIGGLALAAAVIVEASRLIHTPWLDSFRLTLAGALLLGRIFSPWNIVAYAIGIVIGICIDRTLFAAASTQATERQSPS